MLNRLSVILAIAIVLPGFVMAQETKPGKVYELRIYTCNEGKLPDLHARFRDHSIRILAKHGMESLYYWTISEKASSDTEADAKNMLVYVLAHKSREAADASWAAFRADPEWVDVKAKSEANGPLLSKTPVSIFMTATDFSPPDGPVNGKSDAPARLFELRKYNDGPARVPSTAGRFRDWEADLFAKSNMPGVGYWTADDNSAFIYLLAHKDRETARANWRIFSAGFGARRSGVAAAAPATNPTTRGAGRGRGAGGGGGSEVRFLVPTDYSPRK